MLHHFGIPIIVSPKIIILICIGEWPSDAHLNSLPVNELGQFVILDLVHHSDHVHGAEILI